MLEAKHVASVQQCSQCVRQRRIKGYDDVLFGVIGMRAREEVSQSSAPSRGLLGHWMVSTRLSWSPDTKPG